MDKIKKTCFTDCYFYFTESDKTKPIKAYFIDYYLYPIINSRICIHKIIIVRKKKPTTAQNIKLNK